MRQKVPLWYTATDPDTPIHPTMPIKTAIVIPTFSYEIQQVRRNNSISLAPARPTSSSFIHS